ncbi:MAG: glycoside hydrolase domain-containing protein [bacterium]
MSAFRLVALAALLAGPDSLAGEVLTNGSFEEGQKSPAGWRLEGEGAWEKAGRSGQRSVGVAGTGQDSGFWRTTGLRFRPGQLYELSFWAKADKAAPGCIISGPSFCNRDFRTSTDWQEHRFAFLAPQEPGDAYLRLGQWHVATRVLFDDVALRPAQAVHERIGDLVLGEGEQVDGHTYSFAAPLGGHGANYSRPLESFRCGFNSNRWTFHHGARVVYRHAIGGHAQSAASVEVTSSWFRSGAGVIAASTDRRRWTEIGRIEGLGTVRAEVPGKLLPADEVFVRITATGKEADTRDSKPGDFQVHAYTYTATVDADLGQHAGSTAYAVVERDDPRFPVRLLALPSARPDSKLTLEIKNDTPDAASFVVRADIAAEGESRPASAVRLAANGNTTSRMTMDLALRRPGENVLTIAVREEDDEVFRATATRRVPILHDASYGHWLAGPEPVGLWWCEGTRKVSRSRPLPAPPAGKVMPLTFQAARNEYEPAQLVLRPKARIEGLRIEVLPLKGKNGVFDPKHIRLDRVEYVHLTRPTDRKGARGWWPDPLPPFEQGCTLEGGRNHPLWLTLYVPPDQPAGDYGGTIRLRAGEWAADVPVHLRVYDFALPETASLQTGFGLRTSAIRRYHNLESRQELRQVLDLYFQNFAAHRIAPYDPAPLDPIRVSFSTGPWEGGAIERETVHEGKRALKVADDRDNASVAAHNTRPIPVDVSKRYRFSWWVKTAKPDQPYLVTLQQYDADDKWIWGNNIDMLRQGRGEWEQVSVTIPGGGNRPFNKKAKSVRISLRPVPYSEKGEGTGTAWFDDLSLRLADGGPNLLADPGFEAEPEELKATVDFAAWDKAAARTLGELGFNSFRHKLRGLGGGTFHARRKGRIGPYVQGTPEYEKLMASQGHQIVEHLKAKGWLERAYCYWFDEPAPKDYAFVAEGMDLIERAAPGLTRFLTEQPEAELFGHVDLWCPVVSRIDPETIAERKAHGERFWWYLCCGPKAPYIGLFIDRPAIDLRVWAWLSRKWGVEGQLVWTTNYWTSRCAFPPPKIQNPWEDPMSYVSGYGREPGTIGYWGNGDGRFLYPPNRDIEHDPKKYLCGPVNSLRWEMLREGLEDYEYFVLLDQAIARARRQGLDQALLAEAERLATVPDRIIADDKTYSADPQPLVRHRQRMAETIERLGK